MKSFLIFTVLTLNLSLGTLGQERKKIGILLYDNAIPFDFIPSAEIFRVAKMGQAFDVFSIGTSDVERIMGNIPDSIKTRFTYKNAPTDLDVLIIPGGNWPLLAKNKEFNDWLVKLSQQNTIIYGVCTGTYVMAKAGILKGKNATSIRAQLKYFKQLEPETIIHDSVPFVIDGNIVTTAGAATGIDAALCLVGMLLSKEEAEWIANEYLDYDNWNENFDGVVN